MIWFSYVFKAVALKCYECDHRTNGCADPFDKSKINQGSYNDCTATLLGSPTCVKVKSTCKFLVSLAKEERHQKWRKSIQIK